LQVADYTLDLRFLLFVTLVIIWFSYCQTSWHWMIYSVYNVLTCHSLAHWMCNTLSLTPTIPGWFRQPHLNNSPHLHYLAHVRKCPTENDDLSTHNSQHPPPHHFSLLNKDLSISDILFGRPFVKRFALCHQTVVCPVLSVCLSVTLVHCGQTAGWIKIKLGVQVRLDPGHCVRWGPRSPSPKGAQPPISGPYLLWPYGSMNQDATW